MVERSTNQIKVSCRKPEAFSVNTSGTASHSGLETCSFKVDRWVNIGYYVNMAMSEIRKYLDNLKIRNDGPVAPDIDLTKVPKPPEPATKIPAEDDVPFTE